MLNDFSEGQEKPKAEQMSTEAQTLPTRSGCHWQAELAMDCHQALKFGWRTHFFFFFAIPKLLPAFLGSGFNFGTFSVVQMSPFLVTGYWIFFFLTYTFLFNWV